MTTNYQQDLFYIIFNKANTREDELSKITTEFWIEPNKPTTYTTELLYTCNLKDTCALDFARHRWLWLLNLNFTTLKDQLTSSLGKINQHEITCGNEDRLRFCRFCIAQGQVNLTIQKYARECGNNRKTSAYVLASGHAIVDDYDLGKDPFIKRIFYYECMFDQCVNETIYRHVRSLVFNFYNIMNMLDYDDEILTTTFMAAISSKSQPTITTAEELHLTTMTNLTTSTNNQRNVASSRNSETFEILNLILLFFASVSISYCTNYQ